MQKNKDNFIDAKRAINIVAKLLLSFALGFMVSSNFTVDARRPLNLGIAKQRVEKYYASPRGFSRELGRVVKKAMHHFAKVTPSSKSLVVFDIDDTLLSNFCDTKSISFGYVPELMHEWIMEGSSQVIPEVKCLYDYLIERGFKVVLLTGRKNTEYDATVATLTREGIGDFEELIVRQPDEYKLTAAAYKKKRRSLLRKKGYTIVGNVGDQQSDFKGWWNGYKVRIPNYMYILE